MVHDGEGAFISDVFKRVVKRLGCHPIQITPHNPEGNGPIESFYRILRRKMTDFNNNVSRLPVEEALSLTLWAYRSNIHSSTNKTPAFLTYGTDPLPPFEGDWRFASSIEEKDRITSLTLLRSDLQYQVDKKRILANMKTNDGRLDVGLASYIASLTANLSISVFISSEFVSNFIYLLGVYNFLITAVDIHANAPLPSRHPGFVVEGIGFTTYNKCLGV